MKEHIAIAEFGLENLSARGGFRREPNVGDTIFSSGV